jgi:hypothetical protein
MSGFAFVVEYDDTRSIAQNAARRGPDYLVQVPNDHPLLGIGSAYFRRDGAAAPPADAAAVVAVVPDCITLGFLEGLVCDAVIGPPDNAALYGTHCFQPEFLGRVADMALTGLGEEELDIGVFTGLIRAFKENGGLVAQPADLVALSPHPVVGPLPAAAYAAVENQDDPASWTAPFALSSSTFSDFADENGFMGTYAAVRLASGVAGVTAERRGEPFAMVARMLQGAAPRVGISSSDSWARDSIRSTLSFFASSPWPPALADKSVYLDMLRALHDLGARVSFFTGDANQRLRIFRTRSESLIASLPAFSTVVGSAKKALAYDLATQLALRIDPGGDLSSLEFWCFADRKLANYMTVLTSSIGDPEAATAQVIDYIDARAAQSGPGGASFGGAGGPVGGGGGGSGVRARAVAVVDVVSGPKVSGSHGLQNKLAIAASVSSEQMIAVAAGSKLQPVLKYLFFDEKIPVEHEVFNMLGPVLHAIPTYFALQVSLANDGTVSGPAMDRSQIRAKKFKFSDTFVLALKKGDFATCVRLSVAEFHAWHAVFGVKLPNATDFLDAAVRYPEYATFMDRAFSCLGYDRSTAPTGFVLSDTGKTIGDVLTEMALFKRREPRDGMHSSRAFTFFLDVAKMAGVEFIRFLSVGNCNGTLPPFAVDTWEPFTTLRGSSVQVESLRDLDTYAPGLLDIAAASYALSAPPGIPAPPPKKQKAATGVCALAGCFLPVYAPGFDYCSASHAIQGGALTPLPAPGRGYAPLPAPAPFIPPGPPAWSPSPLPPASPFQSPPIFGGLGGQFGGGAPPPGPFQFAALPPAAPPAIKSDPDGAPGKGKGGGKGGGKGDGKGGKGKGRGGGKGGDGKVAGRVSKAALPQNCWAAQLKALKARNALSAGCLAASCIQHGASHVAVNFGAVPTVANRQAMATKVGCGLNDRCWAIGMCLANSDSDAARSLCEAPAAHQVGCTEHSFPADFSNALLRGDFQ